MKNSYMDIRNAIFDVMHKEISGKSDDEQILILNYTTNIFKELENRFNINLKINDASWLHTGDVPECCKSCDKYKEGQVSICDCTLPCAELLTNLIGDIN